MTDVLTFTENHAGRIRLNRPKAIHALNTGMCAAMLEALDSWEGNPAVEAVLIDHAEGRGFCAGGDIRMVAESGKADGRAAREFFFTEYRLNHRLFTYAKPVVAFMDGITMGGGVGISLPAKFRVATENTKLAMPETGIGLFPDVGGGWYLSRLPGRVGQYLALTGYRANGGDCLGLGLATHGVASESLDLVKELIVKYPRDIETTLGDKGGGLQRPGLFDHLENIDRLFASDRLEDILASLAEDDGEWARQQLETLRTKSPQTMKVSLRLLREGAGMASFADEMRQEYAVASRVCTRPDFIEGVRAVIVDKDNAPKWNPATPEGVTDALLDEIFAPLPEGEVWTPA
ncbi:enoyl-CoA hydratase/isomerase family protein [Sphingomonas cannabina]|uniref:enoyl-CoA hydratase/isomerase family protein n=1 Tax=Sphingomonas cannabina TaxID=2899123 RepID=UPI001F449BCA|nr:enoyl-CoA hydratase/isomerase family protein [Sphingomonas cannabina]UIJ44992.1 enoyl-CoA hydratase/isomerase family protein [Sphingomonas cannabina]